MKRTLILRPKAQQDIVDSDRWYEEKAPVSVMVSSLKFSDASGTSWKTRTAFNVFLTNSVRLHWTASPMWWSIALLVPWSLSCASSTPAKTRRRNFGGESEARLRGAGSPMTENLAVIQDSGRPVPVICNHPAFGVTLGGCAAQGLRRRKTLRWLKWCKVW